MDGPSNDGEIRDNGGRDPRTGRFLKGNPGGTGGVSNGPMHRWRTLWWAAIDQERFVEAVNKLLDAACAGQVWAIRELLDRTIGKPRETIDITSEHMERMTFEVRFGPPRAMLELSHDPSSDRVSQTP